MSRNVSESVKKQIAGRQKFRCANSTNVTLIGLENCSCPLWEIDGMDKGLFGESCYEIDHIVEHSISHNDDEKNLQALCLMCHSVKTKRFATIRAKNKKIINTSNNTNTSSTTKTINTSKTNKSKQSYFEPNSSSTTTESESSSSSTAEEYITEIDCVGKDDIPVDQLYQKFVKACSVAEKLLIENNRLNHLNIAHVKTQAQMKMLYDEERRKVALLEQNQGRIKNPKQSYFESNSSSEEQIINNNKIQIDEFESDSEESNYIKIPINKSIWNISNKIVEELLSNERIICTHNKITHSYNIYQFNTITTLYKSINVQQLIKIITTHTEASDKNIMDIALEICRLTFVYNLNSNTNKQYLNGYNDTNNIFQKRTPDNYVTKCNNDYSCSNITDYINTFYEITNRKKDKIYKENFTELYCIHNEIDNVNWNNTLKSATDHGLKYNSKGYFTGLKLIISSCDLDLYHKFFNEHIKKTNSITDILSQEKLTTAFKKWYDMEINDEFTPTDREIIHYFSTRVFKLSSRNGEEFPLTKWKIIK